jgi:hypothetical protein
MDENPATALMREGLTNYLEARYALGIFEQRIQEAAQKVLKAHLPDLRDALTSVPTLIEQIQLVRRFLREVLKGSVLKQA